MSIYIIILLLTITSATIAFCCGKSREIILGHEVVKRKIPSGFGTFLVCFIFIFFFAARWYVGTDYINYYSRFFKLLDIDYLTIIREYRDVAFYLFSAFIGKEVTTNYFIYSLLLGCLIYIPVVLNYRKYSNHFIFTCALYIMLCLYTWPYNGMRQAIAVSMLFAGYPLLYQKNTYWKFAIVLILAFLFHSSVLLVIPFVLLTRMKAWSKKFIFVCLTIIIMIVILPNLWITIINFLDSIGQTKMARDYSNLDSLRAGISPLRLAVAGVPVMLSFFFYARLKRYNPHIDLVINMCVMNLLFLLCGYRVTVIARFATFFNIGLPLLIPELINIFDDNSQKLAKVFIFILTFLHMIILLSNDSGLIPYRFIFRNM